MKKLEKKIRKIRKEEFGSYDVGGYRIGQYVRLKSEYDKYIIYEIVALDMDVINKYTILLNDFCTTKLSLEHFEYLPIVCKKGAKKMKYSKWIKSDDILEVVE